MLTVEYSLDILKTLADSHFTGLVEFTIHPNIIYNYVHYKDGKCHNDNGPAVFYPDNSIFSNGNKFYYLNGAIYSKEDWFKRLTPEQKLKALYNEENW